MRASNFTLQVIIYGKMQFLEYDGGMEVLNNSTGIHSKVEQQRKQAFGGR